MQFVSIPWKYRSHFNFIRIYIINIHNNIQEISITVKAINPAVTSDVPFPRALSSFETLLFRAGLPVHGLTDSSSKKIKYVQKILLKRCRHMKLYTFSR